MNKRPHSHGREARTFYFVRHGATEPNLRKVRCGGDLDVPLAEAGREQMRETAQRLRDLDLRIGVILTSALVRARESAAIVADALGIEHVVVDPVFNERRLGEWNLKSIAETEALLARNVTPPGGESEEAFAARVRHALNRVGPFVNLTPLVVGSKGVARVLNSLLGGEGRLAVDNGRVVQFTLQSEPAALERIAL